ncbi:MAG TPA: hypothetical protein VFT55_05960 [Planctomycetota bacterium]|nr:hypothetical protein [Planctomycetota bacterium]
MARRRSTCLFASIAILGGACATAPHAALEVAYERQVALRPDLATAIAAGALRHALPFADPLPQASGAPALDLGGNRFEVRFEQGTASLWVPCASHRFTVVPRASGAGVVVQIEELGGLQALRAFGRHAVASIELSIVQAGKGSRVTGEFHTELGPALAEALDRAFELAEDPAACVLGLAEPNLAAVACDHLLAHAGEALAGGRPLEARAALQRIERLGWTSTALQSRLGELAAAAGDHATAREHLLHATIGAEDPTMRSQLAVRLAAVSAAAGDCGALRAAARERFADDDLAAAKALLHTARRERPDPTIDYLLASQLHHARDDRGAAHAYALLAREYEPAPPLLLRLALQWQWLTGLREPAIAAPKPWSRAPVGTTPSR